MAKKFQILGGRKVSSRKLSEWGKEGGRPRKWKDEAERKRYTRLQKALAEGRELRSYRNYGDKKATRFGKCSNCGYIDTQYRYDWSHYAWTANQDAWTCHHCYSGTMTKQEEDITIYRAGSVFERKLRWKEKELEKKKKDEEEEDEEDEEE